MSASSFGITVVLPGQTGAPVAAAAAPGTAPAGTADAFAYPADGSAVRTGALSSTAFARSTGKAAGQAVTDVLAVSFFNGEITAEAVAGRANASSAGADPNGAAITNLVVLGQPVAATPNQRIPLADWGYAVTLEQVVESTVTAGTRNAHAAVTALRVVLTLDHGGLPAGAEILVGHAEAAAATPVVSAETPGTSTTVTTPPERPARPCGRAVEDEEAFAEAARAGRAAGAGLGLPDAALRRLGPALTGGVRLPGLRVVVVHRYVRRAPGRCGLAPR